MLSIAFLSHSIVSVVINILYYASPLFSAVSIFYCDYRPLETVLIVLLSLSL